MKGREGRGDMEGERRGKHTTVLNITTGYFFELCSTNKTIMEFQPQFMHV